MLGIWLQFTSLVPAVAPSALAMLGVAVEPGLSQHILVAGLVASRFGLWLFGLVVSQLLQERVEPTQLGALSMYFCGVVDIIMWPPSQRILLRQRRLAISYE